MNRKKLLTRSVIAIAIVGIGFSRVPFISSMQPNAKTENVAILQIDVASMNIGEVKHVGEYYYLYKEGVNKYYLMNGWSPHRLCDIKFIAAGMIHMNGERGKHITQSLISMKHVMVVFGS